MKLPETLAMYPAESAWNLYQCSVSRSEQNFVFCGVLPCGTKQPAEKTFRERRSVSVAPRLFFAKTLITSVPSLAGVHDTILSWIDMPWRDCSRLKRHLPQEINQQDIRVGFS